MRPSLHRLLRSSSRISYPIDQGGRPLQRLQVGSKSAPSRLQVGSKSAPSRLAAAGIIMPIASGGGKMRDPGNEVATDSRRQYEVPFEEKVNRLADHEVKCMFS